ncbi:OsmC family protein [Salinisphaera orenii]|uniref:OsmC family protein n=1 Tax=Salinisphaera orenii TaxID=856731 RepID=UPI000DBE645F
MKRNAAAVWQGSIKQGSGTISAESGVFEDVPYSFDNRFQQRQGTSPEELLAAGHASCYSMALSLVLGESGLTPDRVDTTATVTVEPDDDSFAITGVHLDVHARVPDTDADAFDQAAHAAKDGCPVSKLFNAPITLATHFVD